MNNSGITPTGNHILVKPIEKPKETEGGIFIPEKSREMRVNATTHAFMVEAGPDSWNDFSGPWASAGDKVVIAKFAGIPQIGVDGDKYRVINDIDVTAVVAAGVTLPGEEDYE